MEGLNQGLENGKADLQRTLADIANTISGTDFSASASLAINGSASALNNIPANNNQTYSIYIDGARVNDDAQIENKMIELLTLMARKGLM